MKEQQLFGWDQHTVDGYTLRNMTDEEKGDQYHMDWHLCWKGGKVNECKENTKNSSRQQQQCYTTSQK